MQSEFSDAPRALLHLRRGGFDARIVAGQTIEFGPVMTAYAERLEATGKLEPGRRVENLVVIRADRR